MNAQLALFGNDMTYRLGWTLLHTLWIGAALAAAFAIAMAALRKRSAQARYVAGCGALAVFMASAVAAFILVSPPPAKAPAQARLTQTPAPTPIVAPENPAPLPAIAEPVYIERAAPRIAAPAIAAPVQPAPPKAPLRARAAKALEPALPWLVLTWTAGVCLLALWQLTGWVAARRLKRLAVRPANAPLIAIAQRLARQLHVRQAVRLLESALVRVPTVIGWLRPVILLPLGFAAGLSAAQVESILVHELSHIRRHDYLVNLLQSLVETLLFYHPAVWLISRRIRIERENCCDDIALSTGAERISYAESLLHVARQSTAGPHAFMPALAGASLQAAGNTSELRIRIKRMLGTGDDAGRLARAWPAAVLAIAIAASALLVNCATRSGQAGSTMPAQVADVWPSKVEEAWLNGLWMMRRTDQPGPTEPTIAMTLLNPDKTWANIAVWGEPEKPTKVEVEAKGPQWELTGNGTVDPLIAKWTDAKRSSMLGNLPLIHVTGAKLTFHGWNSSHFLTQEYERCGPAVRDAIQKALAGSGVSIGKMTEAPAVEWPTKPDTKRMLGTWISQNSPDNSPDKEFVFLTIRPNGTWTLGRFYGDPNRPERVGVDQEGPEWRLGEGKTIDAWFLVGLNPNRTTGSNWGGRIGRLTSDEMALPPRNYKRAKVDLAERLAAATRPLLLPGSQITPMPIYSVESMASAVMEASDEPAAEDIPAGGQVVCAQRFAVKETLVGGRLLAGNGGKLPESVAVTYRCLPGERAIARGEKVVWLVATLESPVQTGLLALPDSRQNRGFVLDVYKLAITAQPAGPGEAVLPPGSQTSLAQAMAAQAMEGQGVVAVCEQTEEGFATNDRTGVLDVVCKANVLGILAGKSALGAVRLRYTADTRVAEMIIKKGTKLIWLAQIGDDGQWQASKALADTAANRRLLAQLIKPGAPARLSVQLVDAAGKPIERQSIFMMPVTEGYSPAVDAGPFWADKGGVVTIESLAPGKHRFVINPQWPTPTFVEFDVPAEGLTTKATVLTREFDGPRPDLDVKVVARRTAPRASISPLALDVTISNNTDRPYTLSDSDLVLYSVGHRVFPPESYKGKQVPAKGKGVLTLSLAWGDYCRKGLWCSTKGEDISWPGPTKDEKGIYYRVGVANCYSLGVPLPEPAGPATRPLTVPEAVVLERDKLLAAADAQIRKGLAALAEKYPQIKKASRWDDLATPSNPGGISIMLAHTGPSKMDASPDVVPEKEQMSVLVVLRPPPAGATQMDLSDHYPHLALVWQIHAFAGDPVLDAAVNALVTEALAPLARLEATQSPASRPADPPRAAEEPTSWPALKLGPAGFVRVLNDQTPPGVVGVAAPKLDATQIAAWYAARAASDRGTLPVLIVATRWVDRPTDTFGISSVVREGAILRVTVQSVMNTATPVSSQRGSVYYSYAALEDLPAGRYKIEVVYDHQGRGKDGAITSLNLDPGWYPKGFNGAWELGAAATTAPAAGEPGTRPAASIQINYNGWLTEISLQNGRLVYVWHTLKPGMQPAKNLANYDRHEWKKDLSDAEKAAFSQWIEQHGVFALPRQLDPGEPSARSPSRLLVTRGEKSYEVNLGGSGVIPREVTAAVEALESLCQKLQAGAATRPAAGKLEFRIVPNGVGSSRAPAMTPFANKLVEQLAKDGPAAKLEDASFQWFELAGDVEDFTALIQTGAVISEYQGRKYVLVCAKAPFVMTPGEGKDAWGLTKVEVAKDEGTKQPVIKFELDDRGAELFSALTKANIGNALAILVDGKVIWAPVIRSALGKEGMIAGKFTEAQAKTLAASLKAGMASPAREAEPASRPADDSDPSGKAITVTEKIRVVIDREKLAAHGVTVSEAAAAIRQAVRGTPTLEDLEKVTIKTGDGRLVPLRDVATFEKSPATSKPAGAEPPATQPADALPKTDAGQTLYRKVLADIGSVDILVESWNEQGTNISGPRHSLMLGQGARAVPDWRWMTTAISEAQARQIVATMARLGVFDQCTDHTHKAGGPVPEWAPPQPQRHPGYLLHVLIRGGATAGEAFVDLSEGGDTAISGILRAMRAGLEGEAANAIDTILREIGGATAVLAARPAPKLETLAKRSQPNAPEVDATAAFWDILKLRETGDQKAAPILAEILASNTGTERIHGYGAAEALFCIGGKDALAALDNRLLQRADFNAEVALANAFQCGMAEPKRSQFAQAYLLKGIGQDVEATLEAKPERDGKIEFVAAVKNVSAKALDVMDVWWRAHLYLQSTGGQLFACEDTGLTYARPASWVRLRPGEASTMTLVGAITQGDAIRKQFPRAPEGTLAVLDIGRHHYYINEPGQVQAIYIREQQPLNAAAREKFKVENPWVGRAVSKPVVLAGVAPAAPATKPATARAARPAPDGPVLTDWSAPLEGVQLRLRAEKKNWRADEAPALRWDVRNTGPRQFLHVGAGQRLAQLEVDGVWHRWPPFLQGALLADLGVGATLNDQLVTISPIWAPAKRDDLRWRRDGFAMIDQDEVRSSLQLAPGRHTIRLAVVLDPSRVDTGDGFRVESLPLDINILTAPDGQPGGWPPDAKLAGALKEAIDRATIVCQQSAHPDGPLMKSDIARALAKANQAAALAEKSALHTHAKNLADALSALQQAVDKDPNAAAPQFSALSKAYTALVSAFAGEAAPAIPATKPAAAPAAETADVQFAGRVIDAETNQPVERFTLEWGWPTDPKDPAKIGWGGMTENADKRPGGRFSTNNGWHKGETLWLRVVAEGYLPEPVTPEPLTAPASAKDLVVKLKRGQTLRGVVLDHAGKTVAGAQIYIAGNQRIELSEDGIRPKAKSNCTTDRDGRFEITGGAAKDQRLLISAPGFYAWLVTIADPTKEATINLPEPGSLAIRYDIAGAPKEGEFRVELMSWEMPEWKAIAGAEVQRKLANGQPATITGLTPGKYDLTRLKTLTVGDHGGGFFIDRRTITIDSGKQAEALFVRDKGAPVTGTVEGLAAAKMPGAIILIRSAEATGDTDAAGEWKLPIYDALTCGPDGAFTTERLMPGVYTIIVEAFGPEPAETRNRTGFRRPDYVGLAKVTVPEAGAPEAVKVQIKPRAAATQPATRPDALKAQIDRLIDQLNADQFAQRDAAQQALVKIGRPAVESLRAAAKSNDQERSTRAAVALEQIAAAIRRASRVSFFLVTHPVSAEETEKAPLDKLKLMDDPFLCDEDITSYEWGEHFLHLTAAAIARLPIPRQGSVPFVVVVDGTRCYAGNLPSPISQYISRLPTIEKEEEGNRAFPKDAIRISMRIDGADDPRADNRLRQALEEMGKLKLPATRPANAWIQPLKAALPKGWSLRPLKGHPGQWTIQRDPPLVIIHNSPVAPGPNDIPLRIVLTAGPAVSPAQYQQLAAFNAALAQKFKGNEATLERMAQCPWWEKQRFADQPWLLPTHFDDAGSFAIVCDAFGPHAERYEFKAPADKEEGTRALAVITNRFKAYAADR